MTGIDPPTPPKRARRPRNPRGEGFRLRDDIIAAATSELERTGSEDTITMRAIARRVGVAPPSVFIHFPDRAAVIDAVVAEQLAVLHHQLDTAATDAGTDPVRRLHALCSAYTNYARTHPTRYKILVGRRFADDWQTQHRDMDHTAPLMAAAVELVTTTIQDCIDTGTCTPTDAWTTTAILWFALHGLVTVPQAITSNDWPPFDQLLTDCITRAVGLHTPPNHPAPPEP